MSKPVTAAGLPLTAISDSVSFCRTIVNQIVEKAAAAGNARFQKKEEEDKKFSLMRIATLSQEKVEYMLPIKIIWRRQSISFQNCILHLVDKHRRSNTILTLKFLSPGRLAVSTRPKPKLIPLLETRLMSNFQSGNSLLGFDATFLSAVQFSKLIRYRLILMVLQDAKVETTKGNEVFLQMFKKLTDECLYEPYVMYEFGSPEPKVNVLKFEEVIIEFAKLLGCTEEEQKRYLPFCELLKSVLLCPDWKRWTKHMKHTAGSRDVVLKEVLRIVRAFAERIFVCARPAINMVLKTALTSEESAEKLIDEALPNQKRENRKFVKELIKLDALHCSKRTNDARVMRYKFGIAEKYVRRVAANKMPSNTLRSTLDAARKSFDEMNAKFIAYLEKRDPYYTLDQLPESSLDEGWEDAFQYAEGVKNGLMRIHYGLLNSINNFSSDASRNPRSFFQVVSEGFSDLNDYIQTKIKNSTVTIQYSVLGSCFVKAFEEGIRLNPPKDQLQFFKIFAGVCGTADRIIQSRINAFDGKTHVIPFVASELLSFIEMWVETSKIEEKKILESMQHSIKACIAEMERHDLNTRLLKGNKLGEIQLANANHHENATRVKHCFKSLFIDLLDLLEVVTPTEFEEESNEAWLALIDMEETNHEKDNTQKAVTKKKSRPSRKSNFKKQENRAPNPANLAVAVPASATSSNDRFNPVEKATTLLDLLGKVQLGCESSANVSYEGLTPSVFRKMRHPEEAGELYKQIYQMQQMHAMNMLQASLMVLGHARDRMSKDVAVGIAMHWASLVAEQVSSQRYAEKFHEAVHEHSNAEICRLLEIQPPEHLTAHVNMASRYRRYSYACAPKVSARTLLALRHMWNRSFKPNEDTIKEFYHHLPEMMGEIVTEVMRGTDASAELVAKYKARTMELAAKDMHAQAACSEAMKREIATIPALDGYLKEFHAFLESAAKAETIPADQLKDLWLAFNQLKAIAQAKTLLLESPTQPTLYWHASTFYFSVFYFAELLGMYWSKKTDNAFYSHDLEMYELSGLASGLTYEEWTTLLTVNLGKAFEYPYYEAHRTKHKEESVLSKELSRLQAYSQVPSGFTPKNHPPKSNDELYVSHIHQMKLFIPIIMKMLNQVMQKPNK